MILVEDSTKSANSGAVRIMVRSSSVKSGSTGSMSAVIRKEGDRITLNISFDLLFQPDALFVQFLLTGGCALCFRKSFTQYSFTKFSFCLGRVCIVFFTQVARLDFFVVQDAFLPNEISDGITDTKDVIGVLSEVVQIVLVRYL